LHAIIIPDNGPRLPTRNLGTINTPKGDISGFVAFKGFVIADRLDDFDLRLTGHQHEVWCRCQIIKTSLGVPTRNAQ